MQNHICKNLLSILLLALVLQGCVATQSFPTVARGGDTITLAVGSPDGMTKINTTATFVSDVDGSDISLSIRSIIRLRPDQTSTTALFDFFVDSQDNFTVHSQWLTVLVIDLPEGLTIGTGHINIDSFASYGALHVGINEIPVSIEIIEGAGIRNDFNYNNNFGAVGPGNLSALETLPQAIFRTPYLAWSQIQIAAAEIKITVPVGSAPDSDIRVVADDFYTKNSQDQVQMNWSRNGDEFTVNFVSPVATMEPLQLRFSVVLKPGNVFNMEQAPVITDVKLYDVNGSLLTVADDGIPSVDGYTIGIE